MGFKCQKCNKTSRPHEKQYPIVVEKRDRIYLYYIVKVRTQRGKSKIVYTEIKPDEKDRNKKVERTFTTRGYETVRELKVCKECVNV